MKVLLLILAALSAACTPAPEAPKDLSDLVLYLFSHFHDDPEFVVAGLDNLSDTMHSDFDYEAGWDERQLKPLPLTEEYLGGADITPAFLPELQKRVALAYRSRHSVATHVAGTLPTNQEPLEPSATTHDRTFRSDDMCWGEGVCSSLDTVNFIVKTNALYTVPYDATKFFRRFTLSDGRDALLARVDQPLIGVSEDGGTTIDQNFALDAYVSDAADPSQSLRFMVIWTAVTINGDNLANINIDGILTPGIEDTMAAHDVWHDLH